MEWRCRDRTLQVGPKPMVMGVLNITPDSFSDGGCFLELDRAIARALRMQDEGAEILDVGGESTRPGAHPVRGEVELGRVLPVVEALSQETNCLLSIDTRKAMVADQALAAGAHIINDVSALTHDSQMVSVAKKYGAGVVLMHMKGSPASMQDEPYYKDVVHDVSAYLSGRLRDLTEEGLCLEQLCIDPGIGFGKTVAHNLSLLAHLPEFSRIQRPIVVGASRKSFLGKVANRPGGDRTAMSLGVLAYSVLRGAHVVRVHDVGESCDVIQMLHHLVREESTHVPG